MKSVQIVTVWSLLTGVAFAHGGHGSTDGMALLHYLIEPAHGLAALALIALALACTQRDVVLRRIRK